ncbi:MAG TPA: hypothetical protein VMT54_08355, partial [Candidatus Cybelea sp.]|nr:hypothetical protein [Candidatus Cybelea sp.]
GYAEKVAVAGPAWTALDEAMPIACAGFQMPWPGRAIAWAVLSLHAGRRMLAVTRAVTRALDAAAAERIEAHVLVGFDAGLRWAAALGFKREVLLRKFYRGEDYWSFVLLKNTL